MQVLPIYSHWLYALIVNFILIALAQRLPLLTKAGWIHAGILGTLLWGCLDWRGWTYVVVYLALGSIVTKVGYKYKEKAGIAEARGGSRGPENLWGSAAVGTILALSIALGGDRQILLVGFSASFAAKLADTFGSEIGKRWGRNTFLITSFRPVPAGTDGAISLEGTIASALGGFLMAISIAVLFPYELSPFILLITVCGLLATLLESVMGALLQNRFGWLTNELVNAIQTAIAASIAMFLVA